ncbi:MAG: PilZ domain-containing protein [Planctomycetaceae bacterium]|nr:PilZ domain-containing protein [Planctomycetaceae bacterium]
MTKVYDYSEQRNLKRHYLIYYLRVFNRSSGEVLGHLVDITTKGIMILRDSPIEVGVNYSLRIRWRNNDGRLQLADFDGICRWCRPDVNPDFYGAGFAITTANQEHIDAIQQLITDLAMPDSSIEGIE